MSAEPETGKEPPSRHDIFATLGVSTEPESEALKDKLFDFLKSTAQQLCRKVGTPDET
jgi:hypothetical protein